MTPFLILVCTCLWACALAENKTHIMQCSKNCNNTIPERFMCPYSNCSDIPVADIHSNVVNIYMPGNHIQNIPEEFNFDQLQMLDLGSNWITEIQDGAFANTPSMIMLNLSYNRLKELKSTSFREHMEHLEELYMSHNQLDSLEDTLFMWANKLQVLDLSHNQIEDVSHNSLDNLHELRTLHLEYNNMAILDVMLLKHMKQLRQLDLSWNKLKVIKANSFSELENLDVLDLRGNKLATLENHAFDGLLNLRVLHITHNQLQEIPPGVLDLQHLEELYLNYNPLRAIEHGVYPRSLHDLFAEYMPELTEVKDEALAKLDNLKRIYLQHCPKLSYFSPLAFSPEDKSLVTLVLHNNSLQTLDGDTFNWTQLEVVDLSANPWHCDCNLAWVPSAHLPAKTLEDAVCAGPWSVRGKKFADLSTGDLVCTKVNRLGLVLILVVTCLFVALSVILCYRYRHRTCSCCYTIPGKYRAMYTTKMDVAEDDATFKDEPDNIYRDEPQNNRTALHAPAHV